MANLAPICLLLSATLLAGCANTNKTSFRNMTAAYREVVETYSNENVLLNVVRASQRMPLSFLDIPTVIGSGNIATRASLGFRVANDPTQWSGLLSGTNYALNNFLTTDTGVTVTNAFTFTQASLDNAAFMKSFLSEITPDVVASLSNNRMVPSMAMYTLLVDSIEMTGKDGRLLKSYTNTPLDSQQYAQFQQALYLLVMGGMTTEMATNRVPMTPVFEADEQTIASSAQAAATSASVTLSPTRYVRGARCFSSSASAPSRCSRDFAATSGGPAWWPSSGPTHSAAGSSSSVKLKSIHESTCAESKKVRPASSVSRRTLAR
jgi:hypothetical protein